MRLRPHHLLCTQGYGGKGYSSDFVLNMTTITNRLRKETNVMVDIVFSTDDICEKCPNMISTDLCKDQCKVKYFDRKIVDYFGLEEKSYIYQDLVREINTRITETIFDDICSSCIWYPVSACKRNILSSAILKD